MAHDYLDDRVANYRLMQNIRAWWRKRGFVVHVWLEKAKDPTNNTTIYVIRTDIKQNCAHAGTRYATN